ncbi:response regulator transcription factor [Bacillus sp. B15-48]|uniref:response regulator n=1 Tax=Bacillus sp. B15-48 TaxID=1548601 RepID=UPI00193FD2CC|nr:response regulator [Bacillus sp. B15-48]
MKNRVKVLIVDYHTIVRYGLKLILESNNSIEVCGEAKNLKETIDIIPKVSPELILIGSNFPDGDGINGCNRIKSMFPKVKIIILTECSQEPIVIETIRAGVDGYLLKNVTRDELIEAIIKVYEGECVLDASLVQYAINFITQNRGKLSNEQHNLSRRETEILQLLSCGKSNKEIAEIFVISEKTVRNYISKIFKKINVSNRTEAAIYWLRQTALA